MPFQTASQNLVSHASAWFNTRTSDDKGASLVEYALLLALIAIVCILAVTALGNSTSKAINDGAVGIGG